MIFPSHLTTLLKKKNILIIPQTTPMIQGLPSSALPLMNDGEVKNQGFEMVLGYQKQFKTGYLFLLMQTSVMPKTKYWNMTSHY